MRYPHYIEKNWKMLSVAPIIFVLALTGYGVSKNDTKARGQAAIVERPSEQSRYPLVSVQKVATRIVAPIVQLTGRIIAREEIIVGAQVDSLRIVELKAEIGDVVAKGQVMAVLDQDVLLTRLAQYDSELAKAEANIAQAMANIAEADIIARQTSLSLARIAKLIASGARSQESLDDKRAAAEAATARLSAQRHLRQTYEADRILALTRRREIELNLQHTQIRAPEAGVVFERAATVGQTVSATGEPLFRLIRDGNLELAANVVDKKLPLLKIGQVVHVQISHLSGDVTGTVRSIDPVVDARTLMAGVRISLHNIEGLRPGLLAIARIHTETFSSMVVAQSAMSRDSEGWAVRVVDDGIVATRRVRTGFVDRDGVSIMSGLSNGDLVILHASPLLRDGDRVLPIATKPADRNS